MLDILSLSIIIFLIIDPLGTLPVFEAILKAVSKKERLKFTIIELVIALAAMLTFIFIGKLIIYILDISTVTAEISAGVVLFLIALKMIFSSEDNVSLWAQEKNYIFPVAIPLLAGPSLLAFLTVYSKFEVSLTNIISGIVIAWFFTLLIYLFSSSIHGFLKKKGLLACQRLMGLLIGLVASQLFLAGVRHFLGLGDV